MSEGHGLGKQALGAHGVPYRLFRPSCADLEQSGDIACSFLFQFPCLGVQHFKFFAQFFQPFGKNKIIWTSLGHADISPGFKVQPCVSIYAMVATLHSHATVT